MSYVIFYGCCKLLVHFSKSFINSFLKYKKTDMFEDTFKARLSAHRKGIYQFTVMQNGYDASNKDAKWAICRVLLWLKRRFNFCYFFHYG